MTEKIETNLKARKFKVNDRVKITKYKNIYSKSCTENWSREIFIIDSVLEINPWTEKIKDWTKEKIIGREVFMKEICCWVYYKWVITQNQTFILEIKSK